MTRTVPCHAANRPVAPAHAYFVVSAVFHYLGPAFAVLLFARIDVLGVAWLRIASAALVVRPVAPSVADLARGSDRDTRRLLVAWGAVLAVMNACFYLAIDRLPLGTVAAIEFLPVIVLAAVAARTRATSRRSCSPSPASTCSPTCGWCADPLGHRVRRRQRRAVRPLHRARPPGRDQRSDRRRSTAWRSRCWSPPWSPLPSGSRTPCRPFTDPVRARRGRRRRHRVVGHPLRLRPARDGPAAPGRRTR